MPYVLEYLEIAKSSFAVTILVYVPYLFVGFTKFLFLPKPTYMCLFIKINPSPNNQKPYTRKGKTAVMPPHTGGSVKI